MRDSILGQQASRQANLSELEGGFFSSLFRRDLINDISREINADQAKLSRIEKVLPALYRDLLQHCVLYHDGKEIKS